jgi:D-alanyl-D-alanine carboxypeptidase
MVVREHERRHARNVPVRGAPGCSGRMKRPGRLGRDVSHSSGMLDGLRLRLGRLAFVTTLLLTALAAALVSPAPAAETTTTAAPPSLRQLAKRIVDVGIPGAVVLVRDERGLRAGVAGWGNLRPKQRFGPDHRFRIGSVTKTFVATIALQLVAEGVLTLDDSVERWLPGLVPNGGAITLRHLLNHTSGIYNYTDDQAFVEALIRNPLAIQTPEQLVAVATRHRPLFAPGSDWSYSNTGYIVLGLVVEKATGTPLVAQLRTRIVDRLGLTRTSLPTVPALDAPFAHGYLLPGNGGIPNPGGRPVDTTAWSPSWAWAAGAVVSTARDIARFYQALLGGELLGPAQLAVMRTTVAIRGTADEYGLGLQKVSLPCAAAWGHGGSVPGYLTLAVSSANAARQAVVLVNASPTTTRQAIRIDEALRSAFCR